MFRDINTTNTAGIDRLPGIFLTNGANVLVNQLHIFVIFQYIWKNSQVLWKTNVSNYRPNSLLSLLWKVNKQTCFVNKQLNF